MTLATALNRACDILGLDTFQQFVGSGDDAANTMVDYAQEAGEEIARRVDWRQMLASGTATATPYTIPSDFQRFTPGGGMRTALGVFLRPVLNSSEWALVKSAPPSQPFYFLKGTTAEFSPTSIVPGVVFDYVTANFVQSGASKLPAWASDSDTSLFPERLLTLGVVWRYKRQKGLVFEDELAEFEAALGAEAKADRGAS